LERFRVKRAPEIVASPTSPAKSCQIVMAFMTSILSSVRSA
jgi:hypothetical protein